jgi:hypothetical protein
MTRKRFALLSASAVALAFAVSNASATLLIDEPFAVGTGAGLYTDGGNLYPQTAHGDGLTGTWSDNSVSFDDWDTISGGLTHPSVPTTDGMVKMTRTESGGSDKQNIADTSYSSGDDQVYWVAFLMQFSNHNEQRIEVDFGANPLGIGINGGGNPGIGAGGALTTDGSTTLAVNTTYLFVAKVDGTGNTIDGDAEDQYLWIDPDPTTEPLESNANVHRNTGDRFGLTDTYPREVGLYARAEQGQTRYWDEIQVATSFEELNLVPEPASLVLLGLGVALMLWRRRRA